MRGPVIRPATTYRDFQLIRSIRNECRAFMTHDQRLLGWWRQVIFWRMHQEWGFACYILEDEGRAAGWGHWRIDEDSNQWITGGVRKAYRGKGYGKIIFEWLTRTALKPAFLDVLKSNFHAIALYVELGWEIDREQEGPYGVTLVMHHD